MKKIRRYWTSALALLLALMMCSCSLFGGKQENTTEAESTQEIDEDALKDHYEANRTQYPGSYDEEKAKIMDNLVKAKAASKANELDKEIENIRKTVKYWKPED